MLQQELIELVNRIHQFKAEVQNLEVKSAHIDCPKKLYDTLSSFSNQDGGGILIFGLDEKQNFATVGIYDLQDLQKKVTEQCNQMIPPVRAVFTAVEIDGKMVCSAEIPALDFCERPCYYSGIGRVKGSYIRVGDADQQMTDYEIYSFEAFRQHVHDDERCVERATFDFMDQRKISRYIEQMKEEHPGFSKLSDEQTMEMLAISRDQKLTLAAVLNFGLYPQGFFPQLAITAIVVPGYEIGDTVYHSGERFIDNRRIEGTLPEMLTDAMTFCRRNMKKSTIIDPNTAERADRPEYPIEAIREAVLNALIHRDYSHFTEGTPIQIDFFEDRLEIHSPGGLYGRMTIEDLGKSRPDLRNPALAAMSEFLLETENRYSGIPTIRREMAEAGLPEPVFQNRRNEFVVILYNKKNVQIDLKPQKCENGNNLLDFCSIPRSRKEIAEYLGISTVFYVMRNYIQPLLSSGELLMTIPEKPKSRNQKYTSRKAI